MVKGEAILEKHVAKAAFSSETLRSFVLRSGFGSTERVAATISTCTRRYGDLFRYSLTARSAKNQVKQLRDMIKTYKLTL